MMHNKVLTIQNKEWILKDTREKDQDFYGAGPLEHATSQ